MSPGIAPIKPFPGHIMLFVVSSWIGATWKASEHLFFEMDRQSIDPALQHGCEHDFGA